MGCGSSVALEKQLGAERSPSATHHQRDGSVHQRSSCTVRAGHRVDADGSSSISATEGPSDSRSRPVAVGRPSSPRHQDVLQCAPPASHTSHDSLQEPMLRLDGSHSRPSAGLESHSTPFATAATGKTRVPSTSSATSPMAPPMVGLPLTQTLKAALTAAAAAAAHTTVTLGASLEDLRSPWSDDGAPGVSATDGATLTAADAGSANRMPRSHPTASTTPPAPQPTSLPGNKAFGAPSGGDAGSHGVEGQEAESSASERGSRLTGGGGSASFGLGARATLCLAARPGQLLARCPSHQGQQQGPESCSPGGLKPCYSARPLGLSMSSSLALAPSAGKHNVGGIGGGDGGDGCFQRASGEERRRKRFALANLSISSARVGPLSSPSSVSLSMIKPWLGPASPTTNELLGSGPSSPSASRRGGWGLGPHAGFVQAPGHAGVREVADRLSGVLRELTNTGGGAHKKASPRSMSLPSSYLKP